MAATKFLAVLPFVGILLGPVFLNRVTPLVLGMPLLLAWLLLWIVLTSAIMAVIYLHGSGEPAGQMSAALAIIALTALGALLLGLRAGRGRDMNLEQWTVGGRGFGAIFVFLLMAGEIYTTFTFLGGSGWAYGHGGPPTTSWPTAALPTSISYWMLPPIWRYARQHRLISQPDFFAAKYDSPALGVLVAAGRHRGADPVPRAAVQGTRHHRGDRSLRRASRPRWRSGLAPASSRPT